MPGSHPKYSDVLGVWYALDSAFFTSSLGDLLDAAEFESHCHMSTCHQLVLQSFYILSWLGHVEWIKKKQPLGINYNHNCA